MPNWCNNKLTLSHSDPAMMEKAIQATKDGFLHTMIPCPTELEETVKGFTRDEYQKRLEEFKQQLNIEFFGHATWYEWCLANWGTKWDFCEIDGTTLPDCFEITFDTAWCPPLNAYEKLEEMGFTVHAFYYELGCAFCGEWTQGQDLSFEIPQDIKTLEKTIPQNIIDEFNLIEQMKDAYE